LSDVLTAFVLMLLSSLRLLNIRSLSTPETVSAECVFMLSISFLLLPSIVQVLRCYGRHLQRTVLFCSFIHFVLAVVDDIKSQIEMLRGPQTELINKHQQLHDFLKSQSDSSSHQSETDNAVHSKAAPHPQSKPATAVRGLRPIRAKTTPAAQSRTEPKHVDLRKPKPESSKLLSRSNPAASKQSGSDRSAHQTSGISRVDFKSRLAKFADESSSAQTVTKSVASNGNSSISSDLTGADSESTVSSPPSSASSVDQSRVIAIARYDFSSDDSDMCFRKHDTIEILERPDDSSGWWLGHNGTSSGWFPMNFVEIQE
jgi:hypothetical protein